MKIYQVHTSLGKVIQIQADTIKFPEGSRFVHFEIKKRSVAMFLMDHLVGIIIPDTD